MSDTVEIPQSAIRLGPGKDGGPSFREIANAVAAKLEAEHKTLEGRERVAMEQHEYAARDEYWLIVTEKDETMWRQVGRRSYPHKVRRVTVETIEPFPFGIGKLKGVGPNYEAACVQLRWAYAQELHRRELLPTMAAAREYALRAEFRAPLMGG